MFIDILIGVAVVFIVFIIIVATRPSAFRIERSVAISASPGVVFEQVNDFHKWQEWSPWAKMDPACKITYEGPAQGSGAISRWAGNKKVGEGCMTIVESLPTDAIRIKLEFLKPFKATNTAEFTFKPSGNQTAVVWAMTGTRNFMFKAVCMFMNMDKMVGGDFERGLSQMKSLVESGVKS